MDLKDKKIALEKLGPYWQMTTSETRLERTFKFKNFKQAWEFTSQVALISEKLNHHPDINLGYGYCKIAIWSHHCNNILEIDFKLAEEINLINLV